MLVDTLDAGVKAGSAGSVEPREASGRREPPDGSATPVRMESYREADASRSPIVGQAEPTGRKTRKRKAWAPNDDDHAIYHWVKVECKSQYFVAELFGISQPTVSRIAGRKRG